MTWKDHLQITGEAVAETISIERKRSQRMYDALLGIAMMDVYTREGEEPAHEVMRKIAKSALADT